MFWGVNRGLLPGGVDALRLTSDDKLDPILGYRVDTRKMTIGDLANRAGVNVQSIRFYEREQLLRRPERTPSGYRVYKEHDLEQVVFIKECQHLGFSLKEIKELAELHGHVIAIRGGTPGASLKLERVMTIAAERLQAIDEKICALQQMRKRLVAGTQALSLGHCPASKPGESKQS